MSSVTPAMQFLLTDILQCDMIQILVRTSNLGQLGLRLDIRIMNNLTFWVCEHILIRFLIHRSLPKVKDVQVSPVAVVYPHSE